MKYRFLFTTLFFTLIQLGCKKKPLLNKPALITFEKVDAIKDNLKPLHVLFTSDITFSDEFLKQYDNHLSIYCYLNKNKKELSIDDIRGYNKYVLEGDVIAVKTNLDDRTRYKSEMTLVNNHSNELSSNFVKSKDSILYLLNSKKEDCIPCVLYARVYMDVSKPYTSKTMCLPIKDIVKSYN